MNKNTEWTAESAEAFALQILAENNLEHWDFIIDKRDDAHLRLGQCNDFEKHIYLSEWVIEDLPEEIEDTILHEVAHAIAGCKCGHGLRWKMIAKNLGAVPRECYTNGIPQSLAEKRDKAREARKPKQQQASAAMPEPEPVINQAPVHVDWVEAGNTFTAMQLSQYIGSSETLQECAKIAQDYCVKNRCFLVFTRKALTKGAIN